MKLLLLAAALATAPLVARAQTTPPPALTTSRPAPDPGTQAARQSQRLARALGLNADQQAKVQQILLQQRQDVLAARQQNGGSRKGMGKTMKAERQQADEQLRGVLTPEQYSKYQQLLAQHKQQGHGRRQQMQAQPGNDILD